MPVLDKFRLDDKVVIVTGASSGLGMSFAQACAEAGADVVLAARRVDKLYGTARLVEDAGRRALSELDRLLSALRDEEGIPDPQLAPQPGLGDLSQLVTDVSDGHLPIALDVTGDPDGLAQQGDGELCGLSLDEPEPRHGRSVSLAKKAAARFRISRS